MGDSSPPPPYALVVKLPPYSTPTSPSTAHLSRSASQTSLSAIGLEPGVSRPRPVSTPGPSSNVSLPSRIFASKVSSSTDLDLSSFKVVTENVDRQLVTLEDIKTHLRLLGAFRLFKEKVENPYFDDEVVRVVRHPDMDISPKGRWLWFLEMAVERFRRWVLFLGTPGGFFITPPVDVWLIWHTYMLNPMWYMEDCERLSLLRPLKGLELHPMELVAAMGDDILNYRPTGDEEGVWKHATNLSFDPFESSDELIYLDIKCFKCKGQISTPFLSIDGTGFAQVGFYAVCLFCDSLITRETLGVAKFIQDIVLDPNETIDVEMHGRGVYLPGTLLHPSGIFKFISAGEEKSKIRDLAVFRTDQPGDIDSWMEAIGERLKYSAEKLRKMIESAPEVKDRTIRRMLGAYVNGRPFSVDLVAAAMRQSTFTDKIHQLGWLDPDFARDLEGTSVLQYSILRYYGFLTLIGTNPKCESFFVPTLDIDLVWHTHQLAPEYLKDCRSIASRLIDHDDQVEENNLATGLDKTSQAWWGQFGVPYMYCGCPAKEVTVGQRLARARSVIASKRHHIKPPPMSRGDCYAATHPSDHNSIFVHGRSGRESRLNEWKRRRQNEGGKFGKGKRTSKDMGKELEEHDFPFSPPIRETYTYGCPHEIKSYDGACAVGVSGCAVRTVT